MAATFPDAIFKYFFLHQNVLILNKISLSPIINTPALVQIMAWRRPGAKPLSDPMVVSLLTHICVTRPQRVNLKTTTEFQGSFQYKDVVLPERYTRIHLKIQELLPYKDVL